MVYEVIKYAQLVIIGIIVIIVIMIKLNLDNVMGAKALYDKFITNAIKCMIEKSMKSISIAGHWKNNWGNGCYDKAEFK